MDFNQVVNECRLAISAGSGPSGVLEVMRDAVANPKAMKQAVSALSASDWAEINHADDLFFLNATLPAYIDSPPHNHTMWAVIGIYEGQEDNRFFQRRDGSLREINQRTIHTGEAIVLGPDVIHIASNPLSKPSLGIHVYGGNLVTAERSMWNPEELQELAFDGLQFLKWCGELTEARRPTSS